jgi:hypothetical protein
MEAAASYERLIDSYEPTLLTSHVTFESQHNFLLNRNFQQ